MHMLKFRDFKNARRMIHYAIFILCWVLGYLLGLFFAEFHTDRIRAYFFFATAVQAVPISSLFTAFLPLLLAYFCGRFSAQALLYPLAFLKALSFAYCSLGVLLAYGQSGWVVCMFLLFSASCSLPVFCWFCLHQIRQERSAEKISFLVCGALIMIIAALDHFYCSPILQSLF